MAGIFDFECPSCDFAARRVCAAPWEEICSCLDCRKLVCGQRAVFCPLDPWHCPDCSRVLAAGEILCPQCSTALQSRHSGRMFLTRRPPACVVGQRVQFLRLGSGSAFAGALGPHTVELVGSAAREPGVWWGEGWLRQTDEKGDPVLVEAGARLQSSRATTAERLAVDFPNTERPWFSIDWLSVLSGLESEVARFEPAFRIWYENSWNQVADGRTRCRFALTVSPLFHALLTLPPAVLGITAVHDGTGWLPWPECSLVLEYPGDRFVTVSGAYFTPHDLPGSKHNLPFGVSLWRGKHKVAHWNQSLLVQNWRSQAAG